MELTLHIPDEVAELLKFEGDISQRVLEAILADGYRSGSVTKPQLRAALGLETSYEIDGFLKRHHVWMEYDEHDRPKNKRGWSASACEPAGCGR